MARKRSAGTEMTPQAGENAAHSSTPANKTEAVRLALAAGVSSPTEIAQHIKAQYGMDITPAHVSTIKGNLKRAKKGKKRGRKPGRKPAAASPVAPQAAEPARASSSGLTAKDLVSLIDMARRAGGFDVLQEFVQILKR
jgi:hypothetical protein